MNALLHCRHTGIVLFLFALAPGLLAQSNPVKLAASARFDLNAAASVGALNDGQFIAGGGSFSRQTWLPAADQPRTYSAQFNIVRFAWQSAAFQFTPQSNGTVTVRLMGQWEQPPGGGAIYRQEVLWDDLSATGTTLNNGSFEALSGAAPEIQPTKWCKPHLQADEQRLPHRPVPARLACMIVLDGDADEIVLKRLLPADAAMYWRANAFVVDLRSPQVLQSSLQQAARLAVAVPAYRLAYPRDYARLPEVVAAVSACLDAVLAENSA